MNVPPLVTGVGIVSCLGEERRAVWSQLRAGRSGIGPVGAFEAERFRNCRAGAVTCIDLPVEGAERMRALTSRALSNALTDAGLDADHLQRRRVAMVVGTSLGHLFHNAEGPVTLDDFVGPALVELGLDIPAIAVSSACSSSTDAIALACDLIDQRRFDVVVCGGVDVLDEYKMMGHSSLRTMSPTTCRPFAADSDGTALGEGAAFLVLESARSATDRDARAHARVLGRSSTTDTSGVTAPDETGAGALRAIRQTLSQHGCEARDIVYVNAHGSGTPTNDAMEARVYAELFSECRPAVSSTKSAFGHTLGATGAIEAAVAIWALQEREAPPTAGVQQASSAWGDARVVTGTQAMPIGDRDRDVAISVTYGFGGANACLAFGRAA